VNSTPGANLYPQQHDLSTGGITTVDWYARQRKLKLTLILDLLNGVKYNGLGIVINHYKGGRVPYEASTVLTVEEMRKLNSFRKRK
jgi:hypothetical protein